MAALTVHDLAADWSAWVDAEGFRLGRGRVVWEAASYGPRSGRVVVSRLAQDGWSLRCVYRYVDPDTPVTLVYDEHEAHAQYLSPCVECGHADRIEGCGCAGNERLNARPCPCAGT